MPASALRAKDEKNHYRVNELTVTNVSIFVVKRVEQDLEEETRYAGEYESA